MLDQTVYDVVVIGGGIVGVATALTLCEKHHASLALLEAEPRLGAHQTGNNSGVIHAGLYYKPGSLKAANCARGREMLIRFCEEHDIPYQRCGKLVVATRLEELPALDELERRGRANGLALGKDALRRLKPEEIRELEPHATGIAGLHVPQTGIVDYGRVIEVFAERVRGFGGRIHTSARVVGFSRRPGEILLGTDRGEVRCRHLINCAGLQCDRVARLCGVDPGLQIIPFRGEYYELRPSRRELVRGLIYPVPEPRYPFLGVHFTRRINGAVEAGPNAVLALCREGYTRWSFRASDVLDLLAYPGFWRMSRKHWRTGIGETYRSFSKSAFVRALGRLVPEVRPEDCVRGGAGVRAQAVAPDGRLLDDFHIVEAERMLHVLNAPSPAATSALSIGLHLAGLAARRFGFTIV